ncbi:MAG: AAA family ATPase [Patescibacteria group bacterium]|nr:AAA family ATPase [Patescibacteria group bacterium]
MGQVVINALPDVPEEQLPTVKLKTHAFSFDEKEIITYKDRYWLRKEGTNNWQTGYLKDYFAEQTIEGGSFPINYWDIHTFSPQGLEIIISGENVYQRKVNEKNWQKKSLTKYFGKDFPLEKEIKEKEEIEKENDRKKYQIIKDKVMEKLRKFFRPELINRFDEVVIFEPLKFSHMIKIVELQLKGVAKLLEDQDIGFFYTKEAVKEIVRNSFDPIYGARPLRRAIQKLIENPISGLIIEQKVKPGEQILVDFDGETFVFNIQKEAVVSGSLVQKEEKSFQCQSCHYDFATEIIANATIICPKCASNKVKEKKEKTTQDFSLNKANNNTDQQPVSYVTI